MVIGVIGASGMVGKNILMQLVDFKMLCVILSRTIGTQDSNYPCCLLSNDVWPKLDSLIYVAPINTIYEYLKKIKKSGIRRIVILSSTSLITKAKSKCKIEQKKAYQLYTDEVHCQKWGDDNGIEWVILRPTLIYGQKLDKNIVEIANVIRRFHFFPLIGKAMGLRQPVYVADVAGACIAALNTPTAASKTYNIAGGETLTYQDMVQRIFIALNKRPFFIRIPFIIFTLAFNIFRLLPRYRKWNSTMASRMNFNMNFDTHEAHKDLNFNPQKFVLTTEDL